MGKKVAGTLSQGFLYQDGLNVVAQLDGSGNWVARYVLGGKANAPDYFTNSSGTFRILSDHLGSPRPIVNTSSGAVVEEIDYDEFGNVMNDTAPGATPFGFAGGLYDKDTGLVRFGARDYDPSVGRWTSKDPVAFEGGMNLYLYVGDDPVDGIDPAGQAGKFSCDIGVITVGERRTPQSPLSFALRLIPSFGCKFTYCVDRPCSPANPSCSLGLLSIPTIPISVGVSVSASPTQGLCKACFSVGGGISAPNPLPLPLNYSIPIVTGE